MENNRLPLVGFAFIMAGFVYLVVRLVSQDVPLNLATWLMWVVIDVCLLVSLIMAGNRRPWVAIGFAIIASTVTTIALIKLSRGEGVWSWGVSETLSAACVTLALLVWKMTSGNGGVVAITAAMYVAMIPTFIDQWQSPVGQDPWFWVASSVGCTLEFLGKPKTIAEAFFPACGAFFNGLAAVLCTVQYF